MPIRKVKPGKYTLTSPKSGKKLGTFKTKKAAVKRAGQIAYFRGKK